MALFGAQRVINQPAANQVEERPSSNEWINVGRVILSSDKDGNISVMFVSLPFGLGVDTMATARGNSTMAQAKNALLDEVRNAFRGLKPGEEVILGLPAPEEISELVGKGEEYALEGLFIQLRRVHDESSRPKSGNPILGAMSANRLTLVG